MQVSHCYAACSPDFSPGTFTGWDRLPYITDIRDGQNPSTVPAMNDVGHNFIVANYAADGGCLDVRPLSPFTRPVAYLDFCSFEVLSKQFGLDKGMPVPLLPITGYGKVIPVLFFPVIQVCPNRRSA